MIKRVLVAVDGSEHANKATALACELAKRFGADLILVHVVPDKPLSEAERQMAQVEFQAEVGRDFDLTHFADARGDIRLMSQRLTQQAAETARGFRVAFGERLIANAATQARERAVPRVRTILREGDPAAAILNVAGSQARERAVPRVRTILREGDPAAAILNVAGEENADMIVMGRRGLGDLAGLLLGSVSHKVSHLAECACLTVK